MDRLGDQLLAGTAFTLEQDRAAPRRDLCDQVEDLLHRRALPDDVPETVALLQGFLEPRVFFAQPPVLGCVLDGQQDLVVLERLGDEVEGTELGGPHRLLDGPERGEDDGDGARIELGEFLEHLQPVHVGHHQVEQHDAVVLVPDELQRVGAALRQVDGVVLRGQECGEHVPDDLLVIDYKHLSVAGHCCEACRVGSLSLK